jgi:hypothetical protein
LVVAILVALSGCEVVRATGYHRVDSLGTGGYQDRPLYSIEHGYRVWFAANSYASPERARDFALLRASELCTADGLGFFRLLRGLAAASTLSGSGMIVDRGSGTVSSFSWTTPPKPFISIDVQCVAESGAAVDAKATIARVHRDYELDQTAENQ